MIFIYSHTHPVFKPTHAISTFMTHVFPYNTDEYIYPEYNQLTSISTPSYLNPLVLFKLDIIMASSAYPSY